MATRRIVKTDQDVLSKDNVDVSPPPTGAGAQIGAGPVVPGSVIAKLLIFTIGMIVGPLATYYTCVTTIFPGNSTAAGALAALAANVVLIGYIITAFREDDGNGESKKTK